MPDPVEMILGVAKDRPDPRAVSSWLTAYLGTRPLKAKYAALDTLEVQLKALPPATDQRARGLILRVIQKLRETLVK
jgi:hypothetical protein